MTRLFVCAGEASGDLLATELLRELEVRRPRLAVAGLAGPRMRALGVRATAQSEDVTAVGIVEAIGAAARVRRVRAALLADVQGFRPDLVLTIDSPGLLLPFARQVRAAGVRVVHWVSPQVWAWRPGRVSAVAASVDALLCLFPMEPPLYAKTGLDATFTGHPAVERAAKRRPKDAGPFTVGLAPGSRSSEITALWPAFREVAKRLRARDPDVRFVVPVAPTVDRAALDGVDAVFVDDIVAAGSVADVFLACSGTATLEIAAMGVPMAIAYRVHPLTWLVGRVLVRGVKHLGLPNILAGEGIVPEFLQTLDPDAMAATLWELRGDAGKRQVAALAPMLGTLGSGAIARTADAIERFLPPVPKLVTAVPVP
jgi:lipid-A-disaccharide synthase